MAEKATPRGEQGRVDKKTDGEKDCQYDKVQPLNFFRIVVPVQNVDER